MDFTYSDATVSQPTSYEDTLERMSTDVGFSGAISQTPRTIADLPNELLIKIFEYLDAPPPSASHVDLHLEPRLDLTVASAAPLKDLALVSTRWRATALPILFKHAQFIAPELEQSSGGVARQFQDFLGFIERRNLRRSVLSFTLCFWNKSLTESYSRSTCDYFTGVWQALFGVVDPDSVLIVAPIELMSFFTGCSVHLESRDVFDAPCHYLQLSRISNARGDRRSPLATAVKSESGSGKGTLRDGSSGSRTEKPLTVSKEDDTTDSLNSVIGFSHVDFQSPPLHANIQSTNDATNTDASILLSRPWTKMLLNEGSNLRVYTKSDFWEHETPSVLSQLLISSAAFVNTNTTIRDLEFIALFPLENHFSNFMQNFPQVDRLYVQLVPRDDALEDPMRMSKVEAEDLWMERNRCYALLMRELFNAPPLGNFKYLQYFESGDAADVDAWNMAVEYVKRAGNGWKVAGEGVFERETEDLKPESDAVDEFEGSAFEGALIRWAWNGTTKLPVTARPFYDRPMGPANME